MKRFETCVPFDCAPGLECIKSAPNGPHVCQLPCRPDGTCPDGETCAVASHITEPMRTDAGTDVSCREDRKACPEDAVCTLPGFACVRVRRACGTGQLPAFRNWVDSGPDFPPPNTRCNYGPAQDGLPGGLLCNEFRDLATPPFVECVEDEEQGAGLICEATCSIPRFTGPNIVTQCPRGYVCNRKWHWQDIIDIQYIECSSHADCQQYAEASCEYGRCAKWWGNCVPE